MLNHRKVDRSVFFYSKNKMLVVRVRAKTGRAVETFTQSRNML